MLNKIKAIGWEGGRPGSLCKRILKIIFLAILCPFSFFLYMCSVWKETFLAPDGDKQPVPLVVDFFSKK